MEGVWRQGQHMGHKRRRHSMIFSFCKSISWIINIYPENRTSLYVTELPDEIHLTGRWEIGRKEIQYPLSWFNIEEWVGNFTVADTNVADIENDHKVVYGLKLPVGYYFNLSNITVHIDGQSDTVPSLDPDIANIL